MKYNILIVDDSQINRTILNIYLNSNQFFCVEAVDGIDAVNKVEKYDFDLILMDINMPNMNGIDASKIIKEKHPNIIIIAVSAYDNGKDFNKFFDYFMSKPVDYKTLLEKINKMLEKNNNVN